MADVSLEESSIMDFSKLKVPDLKKELKNRGLSTAGNKNELLERLQSSLKSSRQPELIDDIEEDLLNDDDDEHLDERDSIIELDSNLDDFSNSRKRKSEDCDKTDVGNGPPKKVILKRNNSDSVPVKAVLEEKPAEDTMVIDQKDDEKKVIKLSELSAKERLEMRAKKFGVTTLSDNAKKLVRAERFAGKSDKSAASITSGDKVETSIDVLKQRAARFGVSVSSVMSDLEKQERLEKRKQRFGGAAVSNTNPSLDLDAVKAARLERFKATVK